MPHIGDLACNPGMCPDWESNPGPFSSQASTQSTEPYQPGNAFYMIINYELALTQEVSDFHERTIFLIKDVGGAVSGHRPHLVRDAQCDTLPCGLRMTAGSVNVASAYSISPHLSTRSLFLFFPRRLSSTSM